MIPETPQTPQIEFPEFPERNSSNSGNSLDTGILESPKTGASKATFTPVIERHSLDHPGVVKIALGQSASDALAALGDFQLVLVSKADCTAPQSTQGRRILHCLPISKELADDLFRVANGKARAVKIKPPKPSPSAPLTLAEIRLA